MARANSLMEWIDQTKKFSKNVDYMALDTIDSIMKIRKCVDRRMLHKNKEFFHSYCKRYHKLNPLELLGRPGKVSASMQKMISNHVAESIKRVEKMQNHVDVQWFEVIDFIYERPELIDPSIIRDEYVADQIRRVCADNKKKNPLENGMVSRLGKYWKDEQGQWRPERRKRF